VGQDTEGLGWGQKKDMEGYSGERTIEKRELILRESLSWAMASTAALGRDQ